MQHSEIPLTLMLLIAAKNILYVEEICKLFLNLIFSQFLR